MAAALLRARSAQAAPPEAPRRRDPPGAPPRLLTPPLRRRRPLHRWPPRLPRRRPWRPPTSAPEFDAPAAPYSGGSGVISRAAAPAPTPDVPAAAPPAWAAAGMPAAPPHSSCSEPYLSRARPPTSCRCHTRREDARVHQGAEARALHGPRRARALPRARRIVEGSGTGGPISSSDTRTCPAWRRSATPAPPMLPLPASPTQREPRDGRPHPLRTPPPAAPSKARLSRLRRGPPRHPRYHPSAGIAPHPGRRSPAATIPARDDSRQPRLRQSARRARPPRSRAPRPTPRPEHTRLVRTPRF